MQHSPDMALTRALPARPPAATPGLHFPESRFYIRRVRLAATSDLAAHLREAGYTVEPASEDANAVVVEFPVDAGEGVRTAAEVSMWEQLSMASLMQRYWADNQVSATVTFDPDAEGPDLQRALDHFQWHLKGISFLPRLPAGAFPQMPYEAIDEREYASQVSPPRRAAPERDKLTRIPPPRRRMCVCACQMDRLRDVDITAVVTKERGPGAELKGAPDQFCDADSCSIVAGDPEQAESV